MSFIRKLGKLKGLPIESKFRAIRRSIWYKFYRSARLWRAYRDSRLTDHAVRRALLPKYVKGGLVDDQLFGFSGFVLTESELAQVVDKVKGTRPDWVHAAIS